MWDLWSWSEAARTANVRDVRSAYPARQSTACAAIPRPRGVRGNPYHREQRIVKPVREQVEQLPKFASEGLCGGTHHGVQEVRADITVVIVGGTVQFDDELEESWPLLRREVNLCHKNGVTCSGSVVRTREHTQNAKAR